MLFLCSDASATSFTDIQALSKYVASGASFSGTFDLTNPGSSTETIAGFPNHDGTFSDQGGYVPTTPISSAAARFYFTDASRIPIDVFDIELDGYFTGGIMIGKSATFSFAGGSGLLDALAVDGQLHYTVRSILGDFTIEYALLTAEAPTRDPHPVPEPGSLLLLATGGLGLIAKARRRKQNS